MALTTSQRLSALENALKRIDPGFRAGDYTGVKLRNAEARLLALEHPPVQPPPSPVRFTAPVTARTVALPSSIDATGATDAAPALAAFFGQVPDGSVVAFPANGTFRVNVALNLWRRHHLVLDGNGSRLVAGTAGTDYANGLLSLYDSGDIAVRQLGLVGGNPNPGRLVYGSEDRAHAISIHHDDGQPSRIEIDRCWSSNTWGDFLQVGGETWPDGVWVHDCEIKDAGRSAWSVLAARNVWVERNRIGNCGLQHHNIEPYEATGGADNVHVLDNESFGRFGYEVVGTGNFAQWFAANGHAEASISNVVIAGNRVELQVMAIAVTVGRRRGLVIEDNVSLFRGAPLYGAAGVIDLRHVDGVTVRRNVQPLAAGEVLSLVDCTAVVVA